MSERKYSGYWKSWWNTKFEIGIIIEKHPELEGRVPSGYWMRKHGYSNLNYAIKRYHGGIEEVSRKFERELKKKKRNYWPGWENFRSEVEKMWKEHPELKRRLPSGRWMNKNGYSSIVSSIYAYYGNINEMREKLGSEPNAEENELEELLRGYVEDG